MSAAEKIDALDISIANAWAEYEQEKKRALGRHWPIKAYLRQHLEKLEKGTGYIWDDIRIARAWLAEQCDALKLGNTGLYCYADDAQIKEFAEVKAAGIERRLYDFFTTAGMEDKARGEAVAMMRAEVRAAGCELPLGDEYTNDEMISAFARICDSSWWRRQLRTVAARQMERYLLKIGTVTRQGQIYCSDYTLARRTGQRRRNRKLLEGLEAENTQGQVYTLAELADLSPSNPILKRNELMVRIAGFEAYAKARNHGESDPYVGLFITLTAPGSYHRCTTIKTPKGYKISVPNARWNGACPRETHDYLNGVWSRIRAQWDRDGIRPFGFRMVEPHADGCPHWHMMLFVPKSQQREACKTFSDHALREDADEWGADKYRSKIVLIDPSLGSAAGYVAKYVAKNIDGFAVGADLYGRDAIKSAARIEAWATTWGIRQFQQIGGASVTVWRESRRVKDALFACDIDQRVWAILEAADAGDWEAYTDLMGGIDCPRAARPVRPMVLHQIEQNKYRETVAVVMGLLALGEPILTRGEVWTVRPVTAATTDAAAKRAEVKAAAEAKKKADRKAAEGGGAAALNLDLCQ